MDEVQTLLGPRKDAIYVTARNRRCGYHEPWTVAGATGTIVTSTLNVLDAARPITIPVDIVTYSSGVFSSGRGCTSGVSFNTRSLL
jgi:hypothetical protein